MRIEDYTFTGLPPNLVEWISDVTDLLNQGLYQMKRGQIPTANTGGQEGEHVYAKDGITWYLYVYVDSTDTWKKIPMEAL